MINIKNIKEYKKMNEKKTKKIKFKVIEKIIEKFFDKKNIKCNITMLRWNLPEIIVIWEYNGFDRNIDIYMNSDNDIIEIECNAWIDINNTDIITRKWFYKEINKIHYVDFNIKKFKKEFKKAFNFIQNINFENLDREVNLKKLDE